MVLVLFVKSLNMGGIQMAKLPKHPAQEHHHLAAPHHHHHHHQAEHHHAMGEHEDAKHHATAAHEHSELAHKHTTTAHTASHTNNHKPQILFRLAPKAARSLPVRRRDHRGRPAQRAPR
jgi:hypothetical protein